MNSPSADPTRRQFIRQACCAAVGSTGILSTLAQLRVLGAVAGDAAASPRTAAAVPSDYKALVCLYLNGGNDGTNVIIPFDNSSYADYAKARAEVAVGQSRLLPISPKSYNDGRRYALHPNVPELQSLFGQGKLAVVGNVGTLLQPTTLAQYHAGTALPLQLFSHIDQAVQWQSSISDKPFETGWGGRLADLVNAMNDNNQVSMSISLSGSNWFQTGKNVAQFSLGSGGASALNIYTRPELFAARNNAIKAAFSTPQTNLLGAAFGSVTAKAQSDGELLSSVLGTAATLRTAFPATPTAANLAMVAKLISLAPALKVKRQIFFVLLPGFDTHGSQVAAHNPLLTELSGALKAFYDATVELGVADQVTTFTASDFGRTYAPNFGGTDHGWGNPQFIIGGAVKGGEIYGAMPSLIVGGNDDTGRGRWIPSTSVDEYSATLATWFGVLPGNLPVVLPNIGRFARPNLGFMG
jgi:uncharacterized protein (DUF1501 family)